MSDVIGLGQARRLVDRDGDPLDDGEGRLNINATLEAATVNVGDVDIVSTVHPAGMSTLISYNQFAAPQTVGTLAASTADVDDCKEIIIQADHDNSAFVMVGSSGTSATGTQKGFKLFAGDTLILAFADTASVYIDASAASQNLNVSILK